MPTKTAALTKVADLYTRAARAFSVGDRKLGIQLSDAAIEAENSSELARTMATGGDTGGVSDSRENKEHPDEYANDARDAGFIPERGMPSRMRPSLTQPSDELTPNAIEMHKALEAAGFRKISTRGGGGNGITMWGKVARTTGCTITYTVGVKNNGQMWELTCDGTGGGSGTSSLNSFLRTT